MEIVEGTEQQKQMRKLLAKNAHPLFDKMAYIILEEIFEKYFTSTKENGIYKDHTQS